VFESRELDDIIEEKSFEGTQECQGTKCREWNGYKRNGYARVTFKNIDLSVARYVLSRSLGREIKDGFCALHKCNNRGCISKEHIYEGLPKDNGIDLSKSEVNAKLTKKEIEEIRVLYDCYNFTKTDLGRMYSVTSQTIFCIVHNLTWKWVEITDKIRDSVLDKFGYKNFIGV
jgi:hypothetical protein